jgi:hypothetical protein
MAQVVEHLPSKLEVLSLNPKTIKKKKVNSNCSSNYGRDHLVPITSVRQASQRAFDTLLKVGKQTSG